MSGLLQPSETVVGMRRLELLQGLRLMKLEMILERCGARELSQIEAAEIPGVHERTFRRWRDRYEDARLDGLYDRVGSESAANAVMAAHPRSTPFDGNMVIPVSPVSNRDQPHLHR